MSLLFVLRNCAEDGCTTPTQTNALKLGGAPDQETTSRRGWSVNLNVCDVENGKSRVENTNVLVRVEPEKLR